MDQSSCTRAAPKNGSARLHRTQRRGEEQLRARGSARSSPTPWNSTVEEGEGAPRCAPNCTPSFQEPPLRGATRGGETTPRPKAPRLRRVTPRVHGEEDLAMDVQLTPPCWCRKGSSPPFAYVCQERLAAHLQHSSHLASVSCAPRALVSSVFTAARGSTARGRGSNSRQVRPLGKGRP